MCSETPEIDHPRAMSNLGIWAIGSLRFKAYGLLARGRVLTSDTISVARRFLETDVAVRVAEMGDSNDLGFVIIHPGDLGVSISAHWWVQGSVLCQHIQRRLYDAAEPMESATRPVIGCVWELTLIGAEQRAWRQTMMNAAPDKTAYLEERPSFNAV